MADRGTAITKNVHVDLELKQSWFSLPTQKISNQQIIAAASSEVDWNLFGTNKRS